MGISPNIANTNHLKDPESSTTELSRFALENKIVDISSETVKHYNSKIHKACLAFKI